MSDIDPEITAAAVAAITKLSKTGTKEQKEHFTRAIAQLAECYNGQDNVHALLLVSDDNCLYTMTINADQWEAAGLIQMCYDNMNLKVFQKMPDNYHAH